MNITGDTIEFKSTDPLFTKEKNDIKRNTVRRFKDRLEEDSFISSLNEIRRLRLIEPASQETTIKNIKDISIFPDKELTPRIYIISW